MGKACFRFLRYADLRQSARNALAKLNHLQQIIRDALSYQLGIPTWKLWIAIGLRNASPVPGVPRAMNTIPSRWRPASHADLDLDAGALYYGWRSMAEFVDPTSKTSNGRGLIRCLAALIGVALAAAATEWILGRFLLTDDPFYWRLSLQQFGLVGGLEGAVLLACWPIRSIERGAGRGMMATRLVATIGFGLLVLGLLSLYVVNFLSRAFLGTVVDRSVIQMTIDALPQMSAAKPVMLAAGVIAIVFVIATIAALAWRASRWVAQALDTMSDMLSRRANRVEAEARGWPPWPLSPSVSAGCSHGHSSSCGRKRGMAIR